MRTHRLMRVLNQHKWYMRYCYIHTSNYTRQKSGQKELADFEEFFEPTMHNRHTQIDEYGDVSSMPAVRVNTHTHTHVCKKKIRGLSDSDSLNEDTEKHKNESVKQKSNIMRGKERFRVNNLNVNEPMHAENTFYEELLNVEMHRMKKHKKQNLKAEIARVRKTQNSFLDDNLKQEIDNLTITKKNADEKGHEIVEGTGTHSSKEILKEFQEENKISSKKHNSNTGDAMKYKNNNNDEMLDFETQINVESLCGFDSELFKSLPPGQLLNHQSIVHARQAEDIYEVFGENKYVCEDIQERISTPSVVEALRKLTRMYMHGICDYHTVIKDARFDKICDHLHTQLTTLNTEQLNTILWSLTRLEVFTHWMPQLLHVFQNKADELHARQLTQCLYCLSRLPHNTKNIDTLKTKFVQTLESKMQDLHTPKDLTSLAASLASNRLRAPHMWKAICEKINKNFDTFCMDDLCSIVWAFARSEFTHTQLVKRITHTFETKIDVCNERRLVQFVWAISKLNAATPEILKFSVSPALRKYMGIYTTKELCTICWAYSNAGVCVCDM